MPCLRPRSSIFRDYLNCGEKNITTMMLFQYFKHMHKLLPFVLDVSQIKSLFTKLSLPVPEKYSLLALRGYTLANHLDTGKFLDKVSICKTKIDYHHMRCCFVYWHPKKNKILVVPGSTVPHRDQVIMAASKGGKGANQLEPGFFTDLTLGDHLQGKLRAHKALRQTRPRFIRRASQAPPYTSTDKLFFSNPYDNFHCAWNEKIEVSGFSSAGCMVVAGQPHCPALSSKPASGPWKKLIHEIGKSKQENFSCLLLSQEQISQHLIKQISGMIYGSTGAQVKEFQRWLKQSGFYKGPMNGVLDARTYKAWNKAKHAEY